MSLQRFAFAAYFGLLVALPSLAVEPATPQQPGTRKPTYGSSDSFGGIADKAKADNAKTEAERSRDLAQALKRQAEAATIAKQEAMRIARKANYDRYLSEYNRIKVEANQEWAAVARQEAEALRAADDYDRRNPNLPSHLRNQNADLRLESRAKFIAAYNQVNAFQQAKLDYAYIKFQKDEVKFWDQMNPTQKQALKKAVEDQNAKYQASSEKLRLVREKQAQARETYSNSISQYNQSMNSWNETMRAINSARARSGSGSSGGSAYPADELRSVLRRLNGY